jgi:hypothetical protein
MISSRGGVLVVLALPSALHDRRFAAIDLSGSSDAKPRPLTLRDARDDTHELGAKPSFDLPARDGDGVDPSFCQRSLHFLCIGSSGELESSGPLPIGAVAVHPSNQRADALGKPRPNETAG